MDAVEVVVVGNSPGMREVPTQAKELNDDRRRVLYIGADIDMNAGLMLALSTVEEGVTGTADAVGKHM